MKVEIVETKNGYDIYNDITGEYLGAIYSKTILFLAIIFNGWEVSKQTENEDET